MRNRSVILVVGLLAVTAGAARAQIGQHSNTGYGTTSAEFLLIDNSNSFTKFALSSRERLGAVRRSRTSELDSATLHRVLLILYYLAVILILIAMYGRGDFRTPPFVYQGF